MSEEQGANQSCGQPWQGLGVLAGQFGRQLKIG